MAEEQESTTTKNIVTIEQTGPCKKKVSVEIPEEVIKTATDEQYESLRKEAEVPGFRKDNSIKAKPNQIAQYSEMHPTLVNVNNYHNVRVLDVSEPRIFIQMSYDLTFDDFISKNINIRIL